MIVLRGTHTTEVWRRYSDFVAMHDELSKLGFTIPALPPKFIFGLSEEDLREREAGLGRLMEEVAQQLLLKTHPAVQRFLGETA